jgi:hypothetical protein
MLARRAFRAALAAFCSFDGDDDDDDDGAILSCARGVCAPVEYSYGSEAARGVAVSGRALTGSEAGGR